MLRAARLERFLEQEVWPIVPDAQRGQVITRAEAYFLRWRPSAEKKSEGELY